MSWRQTASALAAAARTLRGTQDLESQVHQTHDLYQQNWREYINEITDCKKDLLKNI